ncbi:MAG TPA: hypothetical protein DCW90_18610 [Lachnospiraceae bacterium]|nr:hypothetical protein [uncultured Lachnoclostridium sp.]HAU87416.1 hypothetical protein [Lachnospiraceae bacterium]
MSLLDDHNIPIGFGMALAQDLNAMNHFANMDNATKQTVIEHAHHIHSREEMREFVTNLGNHSSFR